MKTEFKGRGNKIYKSAEERNKLPLISRLPSWISSCLIRNIPSLTKMDKTIFVK
jgi:hypothetical protein